MRLNRDSLLLLITIVPLGLVLYAFYSYRTTGVWPGNFALSLPYPSTAVPSFLQPFDTIPDPFKGWIASGQKHWQVALPGVVAGGVAGFLVIGVVADVIRVTVSRLSARWPRRPKAPADENQVATPAAPL